jgi:hypothetical protein
MIIAILSRRDNVIMAKDRKHFVRRCDPDGCIVWLDDKGQEVAIKLPMGGVADLRVKPPYVAILPCPYCGATSESVNSHISTLHLGFRGSAIPEEGEEYIRVTDVYQHLSAPISRPELENRIRKARKKRYE